MSVVQALELDKEAWPIPCKTIAGFADSSLLLLEERNVNFSGKSYWPNDYKVWGVFCRE